MGIVCLIVTLILLSLPLKQWPKVIAALLTARLLHAGLSRAGGKRGAEPPETENHPAP